MKCKILFSFIGLPVFLICFAAGIKVRDYIYEQNLRSNLRKIELGMSWQQALQILGKQ